MKTVTLDATRRDEIGKGAARRLRSQGRLPAVVYGGERALSISIRRSDLEAVLRHGEGSSVVVELRLAGGGDRRLLALLKEVQRNPIDSHPEHADFLELHEGHRLHLEVPIHLVGVPVGVKEQGGIQEHVLREVEVECFPANIPSYLELDVSSLALGKALHVSDIPTPEGVRIRHAPDAVVVAVAGRKVEVVEAAAAPQEPEAEAEGAAKPAPAEEGKAEG